MSRSFHEVMAKLRAKLCYSETNVVINIQNTTLKHLQDLVSAIESEFSQDASQIPVKIRDDCLAIEVPILSDLKSEEEIDEDRKYDVSVDKNTVRVIWRGSSSVSKVELPFNRVKELFDRLPEEFGIDDVLSKAREIGLELSYPEARLLMRAFTNVEFDCELQRRGNKLVAIKCSDGYLSEEIKRKLAQEREILEDVGS